jgi:hypothetical protein
MEHEEAVREFLAKCKDEDAEQFQAVCDKYPVQSAARRNTIRKREITVGLLGSAPSRVSMHTAQRYDVDTIYSGDEEG